ncbi:MULTISPECIES: pseudaminic acid cytidylyltransferase [Sphingobacterium]|uniref:pseudaminic acid cytidylyltransferase n=1 Tax=Sphingobacterium TaxID=28453 RepID=UPI00105126C4|nr:MULTISPECIES: pseudaminic acid cytidylyltransferase [Sphingobacterium]MCW2262018.1 N-acylneuraminate cytidylyltransferase [Sphingobacterium kitahiroshimense]TCR13234.1 N-acylneuraminate cytidylyltransferase [Sphingobacterium sp. JUb78]
MAIIQNNICIIPARGGSKRIPRKNIKDFLGKPIIAYSIEAALSSGLFSEVMVSTDDEEIAAVALKYGANVPFLRSKENSNDYATTLDVIKEVLTAYENCNLYFDQVCCIYATAPFVTDIHLQNSFSMFKDGDFDSLFPVMKYGFPIQRSLYIENGISKFKYPEHINTRSQDLTDSYHDAGQFYWLKPDLIHAGETIMSDKTGPYLIKELEGQDIDNEVDWKLAELKYELLQSFK